MKSPLPFSGERPSYRRHRRQFVWHILAPVVFFALMLVVLSAWTGVVTFGGDGAVGRWAAIAVIWLLLFPMVAGVIVLAFLIGVIFLLVRARGAVLPLAARVQRFSLRVNRVVRRGADIAVKPIFYIEGLAAGARAILRPGKRRAE